MTLMIRIWVKIWLKLFSWILMARYDNIEIQNSNKKRVVQCEHFVQIHHVTLLSRKKICSWKKFWFFLIFQIPLQSSHVLRRRGTVPKLENWANAGLDNLESRRPFRPFPEEPYLINRARMGLLGLIKMLLGKTKAILRYFYLSTHNFERKKCVRLTCWCKRGPFKVHRF